MKTIMKTFWFFCFVVVVAFFAKGGNAAPIEESSTTSGPAEGATDSPSPLDLLYEAADDDLNAISFEKSPSSSQGDIKSGDRDTAPPSTPLNDELSSTEPTTVEGSTATTSTTRIEDKLELEATSTTEVKTEKGSTSTSFPVTSTAPSTSTEASLVSLTSTEIPPSEQSSTTVTSTTPTGRIFHSVPTRRSTRRPQRPVHVDDGSDEEETPVVDIKKKPSSSNRRKPVRPATWDDEDDRIEKDIITKIFHGAMRNQERIRNRNLRRLLRRFQVLAFRADLSAEEFHKFMKLVSEYTPSRMPTFLLRKSERRQFREANRVRWQHIREQMLQQAEDSRSEVVQTFLRMVERDGALHRRFGKPRRTQMTLEEFLRRQAPLMRRLLLPPHIEEHPLVRELLGGKMPPSPLFGGCCDF